MWCYKGGKMFGKIENGRLVLAGSKIHVGNVWITNPTEQQLRDNGYKEVEYDTKPEYDEEEYKLKEIYIIENDTILISYEVIPLTDYEHNEIIKKEIADEEAKITPRRQREIDLNKEGAREFEEQIENNIIELRQKLRPVGVEEQEQ